MTFTLDDGRYALDVFAVRRVVRVVEVTPLPGAPHGVVGVVDVSGEVVPVFDLRVRFGLEPREVRLSDQLVVAAASRRTVALLVDGVEDVLEAQEDAVVPAADVLPGLGHVEGVLTLADGLVFLHDLDTILSLQEARELDEAMEARDGVASV